MIFHGWLLTIARGARGQNRDLDRFDVQITPPKKVRVKITLTEATLLLSEQKKQHGSSNASFLSKGKSTWRVKCGSTLTDIDVGNQLGLASSFFKSHEKTRIKYKRETVFGISINIKTGYELQFTLMLHILWWQKHALLGCYRGRISTFQPPSVFSLRWIHWLGSLSTWP